MHEFPGDQNGEEQYRDKEGQQIPVCPVNRGVSFALRIIGGKYPVGGLQPFEGAEQVQPFRVDGLSGPLKALKCQVEESVGANRHILFEDSAAVGVND